MKPILEVKGICKTFKISKEQKRYLSLRESVIEKFSFKRQASKVDFSALENISFEVYPGESVAIIGQNGAGKSTLLKVLSKITPPTRGSITIRGRIAALLEVGTGFHSELTGLENIYVNGSILGLRKGEIKSKIDEIVDFSGVEQFLNTPLKHYSSGMQLRLAFSVAAHLEPEILVIDEVLAVGDVAFQKKCLGKMDEVSKSGRTILFVSHNMEAVEKLTTRGLFLNNGSLQYNGTTSEAVAHYLKYGRAAMDTSIGEFKNRTGTGLGKIVKLSVTSNSGKGYAKQGEAFEVCIGVELSKEVAYDIALVLEDEKEAPLFCTHMSDLGEPRTGTGYQEYVFKVLRPPFRKGQYQCTVTLFRPDKSEHYDTVFHFPLVNIEGLGEDEFPVDNRWGKLYFPIKWEEQQ